MDGIGGYSSYGLIENCSDNKQNPGLPICLADGAILKCNIHKDEKIFMNDVIYNPTSPEFTIYQLETAV